MRIELCTAIAERRLIAFSYDGGHRLVEPYCHGISIVGNEVLRGFQVSGYSASGQLGWKLFEVSKIISLTVLSTGFAPPRPDYNPSDGAMTMVHCCV